MSDWMEIENSLQYDLLVGVTDKLQQYNFLP